MKHPNIRGALCASLYIAATTAHAAPISGQGTWESTLQGRDLDGNLATAEAYYDTVLDITWLGDANYARTSGYDSDGGMNWYTANAWAAGLDPYRSGITGWRLPTVTDTGTPGCDYSPTGGTDCGYNVDTATGEMASMFYDTLGNLAHSGGLSNTGPFTNVPANAQSSISWSAMEYAPRTSNAWLFIFYDGYQDIAGKLNSYSAWAVHAGDVGAVVPVPAAAWLFGSGLLGLVGMSRKRRRC